LEQRKQAGLLLKGLRDEAELTQLELAQHLGLKHYAFIPQVESGLARVPPNKLEEWSRAANVGPAQFAWRLLSMYEPEWYRLLYARVRRSGRGRSSRRENGRPRNGVFEFRSFKRSLRRSPRSELACRQIQSLVYTRKARPEA
jgi:transcriptional regulator with XRE-family HTH domain